MEFSKRRKKEMKKQRKRRILKRCKNMIGSYVNASFLVVDQIRIKDNVYVLGIRRGEYAIYKIIDVLRYSKIYGKELFRNYQKFCDEKAWMDGSKLAISENGTITVSNMLVV